MIFIYKFLGYGLKKILVLMSVSSMVFCNSNLNNIIAMNFKDVKQNFWGYEYINYVAERGLITADAAGYFKPNDNINKFETAKILAKTAGYKYDDLTQEEKDFYDNAYKNHKDLLDKQAKNYSKWQKIADREIAFLLEKNIFTPGDLEKFIIKNDSDKTEKLRALSKEEAAVYLVRIMDDLVSENDYYYQEKIFNDDSFISSDYKPYVYCLYKNNIITGDDNNKFNPKSAVTKTTMSVMLSKTLKFIENNKIQKIESIYGKVDKIYSGIGAIQIIEADGSKNIYKISDDADIIINNKPKKIIDLKENMIVTGSLNNFIISSLEAKNYDSSFDLNSNLNSDLDENIKLNLSSVIGIVDSVYDKYDSNQKEINIKIQMVNPIGGIINQVQKYILADNCKISRENNPIELNNILQDEIVKIDFYNSKAYAISIVDKNKKIYGVLKQKKYDNNNIYLIISSDDGTNYELKLNNNTYITRKNNGNVSWLDLKIGDKITASTEYNNLIDIYAEGEKSTKEGWIEQVKILKDGSGIIKLRDADNNKIQKYNISAGKIDIYSLRVNNKIKINLDSNEIESIYVLDKTEISYFGEVTRILDNTTLRIKTESNNEIEIQCDKNTEFRNINDKIINIGDVRRKNRIYIIMNDGISNTAKLIRIISET